MPDQENDTPLDAQNKADRAERTSGQDKAADAGEKAQRKADDAERSADDQPHGGQPAGGGSGEDL